MSKRTKSAFLKKSMSKEAVVRVGALGGRGFVVRCPDTDDCLIISAAHCLGTLPEAHPLMHTEEKAFRIARLAKGAKPFMAECLFVDPIADLTVLGPIDGQSSPEHEASFRSFTASVPAFRVSHPPRKQVFAGWVLDLKSNAWVPCQCTNFGTSLFIEEALVIGGMSGSPVLDAKGRAVGVCSAAHASGQQGHAALLTKCLPVAIVEELVLSPPPYHGHTLPWEFGTKSPRKTNVARQRKPE